MKINAITAIVSVVVAGAAIYGFAASNVLESQASSGSDIEVTNATCGSTTEPMSDQVVAFDEGKVCGETYELLLMDDASEKECEGGVCPGMEVVLIEDDVLYMDKTEECEGEIKVCPSSDEN